MRRGWCRRRRSSSSGRRSSLTKHLEEQALRETAEKTHEKGPDGKWRTVEEHEAMFGKPDAASNGGPAAVASGGQAAAQANGGPSSEPAPAPAPPAEARADRELVAAASTPKPTRGTVCGAPEACAIS